MKDFGDIEVEGFKRTRRKKKFRKRNISKIEKDGSKTTAYTLEINGENKLHNWEGPALVNEKQKLKEYYLNGIIYEYDIWNEIKKSGEGLPWYKQSGSTIKTARF